VFIPYDTQFTFGSLTFIVGEDGNLKILPPRPELEHLTSVYGQAPCFPVISSTTGGACSGSDPYPGQHIHTVKLVRGIPIVTSILQPTTGHRACPHQQRPPIKTQLMITPRSGKVPIGTPPKRAASLLWWPQLEGLRRTALANIPSSGHQNRPMLERPIMEWSEI
jgi:hypothetical protein